MRFKQYLTEGSLTQKEILDIIEKDCKPFLTDWRKLKTDDFLLSGRKNKDRFSKKQVRKNREPLNTPLSIHNLMDDWFYKKFGIRSRSNAVFCSFDEKTADSYGYTFLIFPIGKYKAVSSKIIEDLYNFIFEDRTDREKEYSKEKLHQEIIKTLEKGDYTDKLVCHGNEIMITCKEYYMVNFSFNYYLWENLKG